jgi:uncharacterized protein YggT (Ycf19 family)
MSLLVAIGREDVADYVAALFLVYFALIFIRILLSWAQTFRALPYNLTLRAVVRFVEESVDPYLNLFRRFIPPIGPIDISPILAIVVLFLVEGLVVGAIRG